SSERQDRWPAPPGSGGSRRAPPCPPTQPSESRRTGRRFGRLARRGTLRLSPWSLDDYFIVSMIVFSSSGIGGIGARETSIRPADALRTIRLNVRDCGSLSG